MEGLPLFQKGNVMKRPRYEIKINRKGTIGFVHHNLFFKKKKKKKRNHLLAAFHPMIAGAGLHHLYRDPEQVCGRLMNECCHDKGVNNH